MQSVVDGTQEGLGTVGLVNDALDVQCLEVANMRFLTQACRGNDMMSVNATATLAEFMTKTANASAPAEATRTR